MTKDQNQNSPAIQHCTQIFEQHLVSITISLHLPVNLPTEMVNKRIPDHPKALFLPQEKLISNWSLNLKISLPKLKQRNVN
jgi:hypothetical protein